LLATPPTVTTMLPDVAPLGTGTIILVSIQSDGVAAVPLNVTVLVPWTGPKFPPTIQTEVPTGPEFALKETMFGVGGVTLNSTPLLLCPPTVITTLPVVAPLGTSTVMLVLLQLVRAPDIPLNATVLVPGVKPNPLPVTVTVEPTGPDIGLKLEMFGMTVKMAPLLATPPTVTTTLPVVAPAGTGAMMLASLQLVGIPVVPLKVKVLVPCEAPKPPPKIVTGVPTVPEKGFSLVIPSEFVVALAILE